MLRRDFEHILRKQLEESHFDRQMDFALSICKRLQPEYISFKEKHIWGDDKLIARGIEYLEKLYALDKVDESEVRHLIAAIREVTPDMDDYGDLTSSYALNAAVVVMEALEFLIDQDINHLLEISRFMTDTIDFKLYENNENRFHQDNWLHSCMQQEVDWQIKTTK